MRCIGYRCGYGGTECMNCGDKLRWPSEDDEVFALCGEAVGEVGSDRRGRRAEVRCAFWSSSFFCGGRGGRSRCRVCCTVQWGIGEGREGLQATSIALFRR